MHVREAVKKHDIIIRIKPESYKLELLRESVVQKKKKTGYSDLKLLSLVSGEYFSSAGHGLLHHR